MEWPELPAIVAGPPTEEEFKGAWPVSRKVPLREIYISLGLDVPEHLPLAYGAAEADTFLAPDSDDDAPVAALMAPDTDLPVAPMSSDDEPILAAP